MGLMHVIRFITFLYLSNSEGAISQKGVLNLHICRLVGAKYYTNKSRGSYIMNESNSEVAELTLSYGTYFSFVIKRERRASFSCVTDLMLKAKTCEFQTLRDSLIKDRIVLGIISQRLRERLLREHLFTWQKAMQICQAAEATEIHLNKAPNDTSYKR